MRTILLIAGKDLRRFSRDRWAVFLWIGIPLIIGSLMTLASGGAGGVRPRALLLVADEDDGFISRLVVGSLGQGDDADTIQVVHVDQGEGRERLRQGEATALLVIPKGFAEAVLREESTRLTLITNPSQRILPGIVEERLRLIEDAAFYMHQTLGPELLAMADETGPPSDAEIAMQAIAMSHAMRKMERSLFPPVIELHSTVAPKESGDDDATSAPTALLFLPGIVVMGLLFAAQGLSGDIWRERESGVLRRVATSPLGVARFLAGKLLAMTGVLAVVSLVVLSAGMAYFDLPWRRLPAAFAWSTTVGVLLASMLLTVQAFASTRNGASILSYAIVMPLMMFGGCMFPLEMMPSWMAAVGRRTPDGFGVVHLQAILQGSESPTSEAAAFALVVVGAATFFLICAMRVHRVFARR